VCPGTGKNTTCEVSTAATDPFTSGASYPNDKQALCAVDFGDFGVSATSASLIDACSYTTPNPFAGASDCVVTKACTTDSQCDDSNSCTLDSCSTVAGTCVHTPDTGASCNGTAGVCEVQDTCSALGFCQDNGYKPAETACGDPSDTECDNPNHCSGTDNTCVPNYETAGANCGDAAGVCTNQDKCDGAGGCTDNGFKDASTACGDPTDDACNNPTTAAERTGRA